MESLSSRGVKCIPFKPIESGVTEVQNSDAHKLWEAYSRLYKGEPLSISDLSLYSYEIPAAPFIAKQNDIIDIERIKNKASLLEKKCDVLLIEGAGGLFVPIEHNFFMIDLAAELADFTILVSRAGLGCINDSLLSQEALKARGAKFAVIYNERENDRFEDISKPFLSRSKGGAATLKELEPFLEGLGLF